MAASKITSRGATAAAKPTARTRASAAKVASPTPPARAGRAANAPAPSQTALVLRDIHAESKRITADLATLLARLDG